MGYTPSIAIHPGQTLAQELEVLGVPQRWLSDRTGLSEKHISKIINGEASITADTATRLENAMGGSATFWVNLNSNYETTKAKIAQREKAATEINMLSEIPYSNLASLGWVETTNDKVERVMNLNHFFGVNSLTQIPVVQNVAFRQARTTSVNRYALAAWLRKGEMEAAILGLPEYSEAMLKAAIPQIRLLAYEMPDGFYGQLCNILGNAGVGLVAVKNPKNTSVNGATRRIGRNPFIQLSLRGRNADIMWFTLFHEIGHILLHGKRGEFISFDKTVQTSQEIEADSFASETLFPSSLFFEFVSASDFSLGAVNRFADKYKINPCVIMGRLEHEKTVPYALFSQHHTKLTWKD